MTDTMEVNIAEAIALIDAALGTTMSRELMSAGEVSDLLLDVRMLLAVSPTHDLLADEDPIPAAIS